MFALGFAAGALVVGVLSFLVAQLLTKGE